MRQLLRWLVVGLTMTGASAHGLEAKPPAEAAAPEHKPHLQGDAALGEACLKLVPGDSALKQVFQQAQLSVKGTAYGLDEVRFLGLKALDEAKVWTLLGGRPAGTLSLEQGAAIVARLAGSGLFVKVVPRLDAQPQPQGGAVRGVLEVQVEEHPTVLKVEVEGAQEMDRASVLAALFEAPSESDYVENRKLPRALRDGDDDDDDEDDDDDAVEERIERAAERAGEKVEEAVEGNGRRRRDPDTGMCELPLPPPDWVARSDGDRFDPGIAWRGLADGIKRVRQELRDEGYLLGSVSAELSPDGTLRVRIDEGRLERVELVGLHPALAPRVEKLLNLQSGEILLRSDVDQGLERVRRTLPFVAVHHGPRVDREPERLVEEVRPDGTVTFTFTEAPPSSAGTSRRGHVYRLGLRLSESSADSRERAHRHRRGHDEDGDDEEGPTWMKDLPHPPGNWDWDEGSGDYLEIEGKVLRVHLQVDTASGDVFLTELLRHTQVTSFAPGLLGTLRYQDPADRFRVAGDLGVWFNTAREGRERFDFLVGPRVALPLLKLAELGVQYHVLTDTTDRWRLAPVDSYLQSLLLNRPSAEYFRRSGITGFASTEPLAGFVLGAEYRLDDYASLATPEKVFTLFNRDEAPFPNPAIDDGRIGSVLLRLEWSNRARNSYALRSARRDPELSLYAPLFDDRFQFRTANTVEIASRGLGGGAEFIRLSSVNAAYFPTGRRHGVWLRLRGAGGNGLPAQKREALGGWGSLRGYDFKELRGDFSLLGSAEYQWQVFSLFVDLGSVRDAGAWAAPRLGFGAAFNLGEEFHVAAAWRTDDQARLAPQVMAFFRRPF